MLHKQFIVDVFGNNKEEIDAAQVAVGKAFATWEEPGYSGGSHFGIRRRERRVVRCTAREHEAKRRWIQGAVLVALLELGAGVWLNWGPANRPTAVTAPARLAEGGDISAVLGATASIGTRRVYAFSVVPGGVTSQEELVRVVEKDRVVAEHYGEIDLHAVHSVKASAKSAYMSYRKGDEILWTRHKVALKEGELLLSDGEHEIRSRCGNRISDVARMPVADMDPPRELLDSYTDVPVVVVVPERKPQPVRAQQQHADIAEPGTLGLLAAGAGALIYLRRRLRGTAATK